MTSQRFSADERFQRGMRPVVTRIYEGLFLGCRVEHISGQPGEPNPLDSELGIDAKIHLTQGQWISVQEKFRRHEWLKALDFTQEYYNAVGTEYEEPGEWFHLAAHVYFYGWANESQDDFAAWALLDVLQYKLLVDRAGGLHKLGKLRQNRAGGSASFYAIPIGNLRPAILKAYGIPPHRLNGTIIP